MPKISHCGENTRFLTEKKTAKKYRKKDTEDHDQSGTKQGMSGPSDADGPVINGSYIDHGFGRSEHDGSHKTAQAIGTAVYKDFIQNRSRGATGYRPYQNQRNKIRRKADSFAKRRQRMSKKLKSAGGPQHRNTDNERKKGGKKLHCGF